MNKQKLIRFVLIFIALCIYYPPVTATNTNNPFNTQPAQSSSNSIGSGDYKFIIDMLGDGDVTLQPDNTTQDNTGIALVFGANSISEVNSTTLHDAFSKNKGIKKGDIIILKNNKNHYAILKILSIKNHPVDNHKDSLVFEYIILTNNDFDFSNSDNTSNVPIASFTATPTSGKSPLTVALDASASHPYANQGNTDEEDEDDYGYFQFWSLSYNRSSASNAIISYKWSSSDNQTADGKKISLTFTKVGTHVITLVVTDAKGKSASAQKTITVLASPTQANKPPIASFTANPTSGTSPLIVSVDASASSDSDGSIVGYAWNIVNSQPSTGKTASFTFNQAGTYTISLTVTDNQGATASTSKSITVINPKTTALNYNQTARLKPQIIMAGMSPSIIDLGDTEFEILALVRPGVLPLQSVTLGQGANPLFNLGLQHINTLPNGDQFWKTTFAFERGAFGVADLPIKWGNGTGEFFIRATDTNQQSAEGLHFPTIQFDNAPAQQPAMDTVKNDNLSYNGTKRFAPQIIMGGVSPAIVDILDTSFDIMTLVRPGFLPIQNVILSQGGNKLFNISMEKRAELSNGDQIWVSTFIFPRGNFGITSIPVVWGTDAGEFTIQVIDTAQQISAGYPIIRSGNYPAMQ